MLPREETNGKWWAVTLAALVWLAAACDNIIDDRNPYSPVPQAFIISPANVVLGPGGSQTFTATNGTTPISWTVSNTALANINVSTGVLVAGTTAGTFTVTAADAENKVATATVTITTATILVTPSTLTLNVIPGTAPDFDATGNVGTVFFTLSGATNGYTGATIDTGTGIVTITALPSVAEGTQTLTITAADGIAVAGTATLILTP